MVCVEKKNLFAKPINENEWEEWKNGEELNRIVIERVRKFMEDARQKWIKVNPGKEFSKDAYVFDYESCRFEMCDEKGNCILQQNLLELLQIEIISFHYDEEEY